MTEQTRLWLALSLLPGLGRARLSRLRRQVPDPAGLLREPPGVLTALGLPAQLAERLPWSKVESELARAEQCGARILSPADPAFPQALERLADGPCLLYLKGSPEVLGRPAVAIVGTRRATSAGLETARRLAAELAAEGVPIVSGLARGIDSAAHRGALEARGQTVAVLGGGLGRPYPPENSELLAAIADSGAVLTEYAMEAEPFLGAFLRRNRWIAALSSALVLVEAPVSSGALKTAGHARELGRPVLVAPGPMYAESWAGSNRLLRDGAQIVTQSADVLARLGLGAPRLDSAGRRQGELWPEAQSRVFECLEALPLSLEEIVQRSGLTPAEVGGALVALELAGALRRHPGLLYGRP